MLARLLSLYTVPNVGLTNTMRATIAMRDDTMCVQLYAAAVEELSEAQITNVQRTMKCVGTDGKTLEGMDDYHQLAMVRRQAKGEGAKVIGERPLLLGGRGRGGGGTMHAGWKHHLANVAHKASFTAKKSGAKEREKKHGMKEICTFTDFLMNSSDPLVQVARQKTER